MTDFARGNLGAKRPGSTRKTNHVAADNLDRQIPACPSNDRQNGSVTDIFGFVDKGPSLPDTVPCLLPASGLSLEHR